MNILPERLPFLSDDLSRKGALTRLTAHGLVAGRLLKECDYDSLVVNCLPEVSEALRAAEVIGSASILIHLRARGAHDGSSKQVMRIDVLCAEVDEETEEFRRFVIFEDKLFRRPEAHRDVLGQILDYRVALRDIEPNSMASLLHDEQQAWVTANRDLMRDALRNGKFLLVVCGDRIRPRLLKYLRDLGEQMDPMFAADFAVLSLALYSDGTTHLLIPHVVVRTEVKRWLKIDLTLRDQSGAEVAVHGGTVDRQPTIVKQDPPPRTQIELEQLRSAILETAGAGALEVANKLFAFAEDCGAEVIPASASASVRIRNSDSAKACTLFVVTRKATFYLSWLDRWRQYTTVPEDLARRYAGRLAEILGRSAEVSGTSGANAVPLALVGKHLAEVQKVIGEVVKPLMGLGEANPEPSNPPMQPAGSADG